MDFKSEMTFAKGTLKCEQVSMDVIEYEWAVENVEPFQPGKNIQRSPAFFPVLNISAQMYFQLECEKLSLHLGGNHYMFKVKVSINIKSVGNIPNTLKSMVETSILDDDGTLVATESNSIQSLNNQELRCLCFKSSKTMNATNYLLELPLNDAIIRCRLRFLADFMSQPPVTNQFMVSDCKCYTKSLSQDLGDILESSSLTDVTIQVGSKIIKAHRAILAARSPAFKMMFEHDCVESRTNSINIPNYDLQIIIQFVKYIYTGFIDTENFDGILSLYELADIYNVVPLQKRCSEFIKNKLTTGNVEEIALYICRILKLADQRNNVEIKEMAVYFITRYFLEVVKQPDWNEFLLNDTKLVSEVFVAVSSTFQSYFQALKGCSDK